MKRLIVFDLDGTLAKSKSSLDQEMASLFDSLLGIIQVAVISGGDWPQFEKQLLANLFDVERLANLSLLPTCGTKFFQYDGGWQKKYSDNFDNRERTEIIRSLNKALELSEFKEAKAWGELIEDRGSQVTFSALGQDAPAEIKQTWDPDFVKRKEIVVILTNLLPQFSIRMGGTTSIDITKPGIDKAYGIRRLQEILEIPPEEMVFIGDALFPGGNDYPVKEIGVKSIEVRDPNETKRVIEAIIACLT